MADILRETKTLHGYADPTAFALEVPAAWFAARGIGPGAKIRGVDPTRPYDGSERLEPGGWTARFPRGRIRFAQIPADQKLSGTGSALFASACTMQEIADHFRVHCSTVSRAVQWLKLNPCPMSDCKTRAG